MDHKFHKIQECKPLAEYKLWISFDDGTSGEVDMSNKVGKGVFKLWEDFNKFSQAKVSKDGRSLRWNENLDLCADSLYLKVNHLTAKDIFGAL